MRHTHTPCTHLLQLCPVLLKLLDTSLILCPLLLEKSQPFLKICHLIRDLSWLLSEGKGRKRGRKREGKEEGGEGEGHKARGVEGRGKERGQRRRRGGYVNESEKSSD